MHFTSTANTNRSINLKDKLTFTNSTSLSVNNIFFELLFNRSRVNTTDITCMLSVFVQAIETSQMTYVSNL